MRIKFGRRGDAKLSQLARAASIARLSRHLSQKSSAEPREAGRRKLTGANTPVTKQNGSLFLKVVNFDRSFLGRIGEPARDALLHLRH